MRLRQFTAVCFVALAFSCNKNSQNNNGNNNNNNPAGKLAYKDSVLFIKNTSYTVSPVNAKPGTYTAFPDNLLIDKNTGAITVSLKGKDGESQTGLRYKIKFTSDDNQTDSTYITISGITYVDRFHNLALNDSIIYPIYNADLSKALPPGNYNVSSDNKLALNPVNGQINIKETIRRGYFNNQLNGSWKQTNIKYVSNDNSGVTNSIDIILYYYDNMNEVPSNVSALMRAHQQMTVGLVTPEIPSTIGGIDNNLSSDLSMTKPRPPCIIIVAH